MSKQVLATSFGMLAVGGLFYTIGQNSNKNPIQKAGLIILIIVVIILLLSSIISAIKDIELTKKSD